MSFHYARDIDITGKAGTNYHNQALERDALLYHWLRCRGVNWLWECDGEYGPNGDNPNHVDDGNMEEVGTAKYAAVGTGLITKSPICERGTLGLKVVSAAPSDGARTIALRTISNALGGTFGAGDSLAGPVNKIMTLVDNAAVFTTADVGCPITLAGEGNAGNNGTFIITEYVSITTVKLQNPSGVAVSPPTGTYNIRRPYDIVLYANNDSGSAWDVEVDQGDGSFVNVGSIPDNAGVWTLYHFQFSTLSTGSRYVRFLAPAGTLTIYIDSFIVFRSNFEYQRLNVYGSDGILTNPDRFSTGGSYTPGTQDIGRWLCVWDSDHPKNSGCYKVLADLGGGILRVDLKSGSATFTTHAAATLNWRIIDVQNQFGSLYPAHQLSCGYGIQSPHSSSWRLFTRQNWGTGLGTGHTSIWAAPTDEATFDMSDGHFYSDGTSTQRYRQAPYHYLNYTSYFTHVTRVINAGAAIRTRSWFMTDDDFSFIAMVHWNAATANDHGGYLIGYMGADPAFPDEEEFHLLAPIGASSLSEFDTIYTANSGWYWGTTFNSLKEAVHVSIGTYGYSSASDVKEQSNASDNPWSAEEVLLSIPLIRDPSTTLSCPGLREIDGATVGVYWSRGNLPVLATFASAQYIHFADGYCWKWNGETIL